MRNTPAWAGDDGNANREPAELTAVRAVMPPEICPNCGAEVPPRARTCPQCGSDEKTGWSDEARHGGLDLPDEQFDYDEYVEREFGGKSPKPRGLNWFWWLVALLLLVALALVYLR